MFQLYVHDCARQQLTPLCPEQFETHDDAKRHLEDQHDDLDLSEYGFEPAVCEIVAFEIQDGAVIPDALDISQKRETGTVARIGATASSD